MSKPSDGTVVGTVKVSSDSRKLILGLLQQLNIGSGDDNDGAVTKRELLNNMVDKELTNSGAAPSSAAVCEMFVPEGSRSTGSKVRCSLCVPHLLHDKKTVVVTASDDLKELLALATKKLKVKKPLRAFVMYADNKNVVEIFSSSSFKNGAVVAVTNGSSFEDALSSKGKAKPAKKKAPRPKTPASTNAAQDLVSKPKASAQTSNPQPSGDDDAEEHAALSLIQRVRTAYADSRNSSKRNVGSIQQSPSACQVVVSTTIAAQRDRLPAQKNKQLIAETIHSNQAIVLCGETGCGKTTQVPQIVLDHATNAGAYCNIICTQPRRLSAVAVASRVADERGQRVGQQVGYTVRLEQKCSPQTRIEFCTVGILLRRLQGDPSLKNITHVMIDEVHERDVLSDFILIVLRDLMAVRPDLKFVFMSATVNSELFSGYFGGCPVITIPGLSYPVEALYLEDALAATGFQPRASANNKNQGGGKWAHKSNKHRRPANDDSLGRWDPGVIEATPCSPSVAKALANMQADKISHELIHALVEYAATKSPGDDNNAVLVFLPGLQDITKLHQHLVSNLNKSKFVVYPLHSKLSGDDQRQIFKKPPRGVCKVILSTNIAETSVTIDDVGYVIDTGRVKENHYDNFNGMPALVETWVSRASARQRRGRAGRTHAGTCFHLYPRHFHDNVMREYTKPEILRTSLDELVLQIKLLQLGGREGCPFQFLGRALEPPPESMIRLALESLRGVNALVECMSPDVGADFEPPQTAQKDAATARATDITHERVVVDTASCYGSHVRDKTVLTPLGFHLALLPMDVRLGKLLIMGAIFKCLDPVLTICAAISEKSPFKSMPFGPLQQQASAAKRQFAMTGNVSSDLLAIVNAYNEWQACKSPSSSRQEEWDFINDNFLSVHALKLIERLRMDFARQLQSSGFLPSVNGGPKPHIAQLVQEYSVNSDRVALLQCVFTAGFYPHVAYISSKGKVYASKTQECAIHPGSVNARMEDSLGSKLLVYCNKIKSSRVFLCDTTPVKASMLLLFGGDLRIDHTQGTVNIGKWLQFKSSPRSAVLFKYLREVLDEVLVSVFEDSLESKRVDAGDKRSVVIDTVAALLGS